MRSLERVPHSLTKVAADTANADQAVGQKMGRPLGGSGRPSRLDGGRKRVRAWQRAGGSPYRLVYIGSHGEYFTSDWNY